jgi:multidrug efflux pump
MAIASSPAAPSVSFPVSASEFRSDVVDSLFYRNPRITVLFVALILVAGLSSYQLLPRMEDPLLVPRFAMIQTVYPGAGAERVESLVTDPIEDELQEVDEIKEVRSVSKVGISSVTVELRDEIGETEADAVWSRIRDKIDDAVDQFPPGVLEPEFEELDVKAYATIVALQWQQVQSTPDGVSIESPPNYAVLRRLAEELGDQLEAVPGTEEVDLYGDPDEEITVEVNVEELTSRGLTVGAIAEQIAASDSKAAAGQFRGDSSLLIEVDGELDTLDRIRRIPIQYSADGRFALLADLARINRNVREPLSSLAIVDGVPAVVLGVMVRPTVRIDHWAVDAEQAIADFGASLPDGIHLNTIFQQSRYVSTRLSELQWNLLAGAAAVALVILVLMGWRSAVIVSSALPLSALVVLAGMRALDIPIHQMSVTGLIVALGLLIDNAIVVVDEVSVKLRAGQPPTQAVSSSVRHLAIPLLGSTVTTALAFAPIALMPGPAGEFVGSIAISVMLAIGSSLVLALTVVPAIAARFTPPAAAAQRTHWWEDGLHVTALQQRYDRLLKLLYRHPVITASLCTTIPLIGFVQLGMLPEQFFPPADRDQFHIEVDLPAQMSLSETRETVAEMQTAILQNDEIESVAWFIGESAPGFYYNLIPRRKNTASHAHAMVHTSSRLASPKLIQKVQQQLNEQFPKARSVVRLLEQGPPFDAPVEVRLYGPNLEVLKELGEAARLTLSEIPNVVHTRSDVEESVPKVALSIMEEEARLAGLDYSSIARQLNVSLEGAVGGSILEETEELPIRVRVADADRGDLSRIRSLEILGRASQPGSQPSRVPLSAIADVRLLPEVSTITRLDGRRMNEVQAYLVAGTLPATVQSEFERRLAEQGTQLPPRYEIEFGGESAERDESVGNLMASVGILGVMMVTTLVLSFSSFRMAGIIGIVAMLSAGMGFSALAAFGYPFGFMAIIGTMGLIGVAINDSIVVLAAIRGDADARTGDRDAIRRVVQSSTRHVVATTLTTIAGFLPLLLGGGGFWPPLAVTIAGGVGGATLLALIFSPAAYIIAMCRDCPADAPAPAAVPAKVSVESAPA